MYAHFALDIKEEAACQVIELWRWRQAPGPSVLPAHLPSGSCFIVHTGLRGGGTVLLRVPLAVCLEREPCYFLASAYCCTGTTQALTRAPHWLLRAGTLKRCKRSWQRKRSRLLRRRLEEANEAQWGSYLRMARLQRVL